MSDLPANMGAAALGEHEPGNTASDAPGADAEIRVDRAEMTQVAPFPVVLDELVKKLTYRPGWTFWMEQTDRDQGSVGLTFVARTRGYDSYHPDRGPKYGVLHYFPVPPAAYNERSWCRWLLDCLLKVESHECCEFFTIDGVKRYAPAHGPGNDPYLILEYGDDADRRTSFRGQLNPA